MLARKYLSRYSSPELSLLPVLLQGKNKCRLAFNLQLRRFIHEKIYLIGSSKIRFAEFYKGVTFSNFVLITDSANELSCIDDFSKVVRLVHELYSNFQVVIFPDTVWIIGGEFEFCFSINDKNLIKYILDYIFRELS